MADLGVHQTPFGYVMHIDRDGTVRSESRSHALDALLGLSPEEIQAKGGWQAFIPPDDLAVASDAIEQLLKGATWEGELRVETASDEMRHLHLYSEAELLDDGSVRVEGYGHDVTETIELMKRVHELEERMRLLIDHVSAFTWTTDLNTCITSIEGAALALIDLDPRDVVGRTVPEFLGSDGVGATVLNATTRALKGEVVSYKTSWEGNAFSAIAEPLRDLEGNIIGTLGVAVLMYNYQQRTEQVRNLRSELQQARMTATGLIGGEVIAVGDLVVNPIVFAAWKGDKRLSLSPTEFRLLLEFVKHQDQAISRAELLERVWNHKQITESRLVDMAVKRLRDKIEDDPANPRVISTVRGVGYRLEGRTSGAA